MTRFVVCLDGTWSNAAKETEREDKSKVYRPTNVLKVARAVQRTDASGVSQETYYDTGIGSMNRAPTGASKIVRTADNILGGALGAGFEINIEEAYTYLVNNWTEGDEIFIFGFSRGAAQARSLVRFIGWVGGFPEKTDAYYVPMLYTDYLDALGKGSGAERWEERNERRRKSKRPLLAPIRPAQIRYLGVWDTVAALDSRFRPRWQAPSEKAVFHVPSTPPENVDRIRHALAIDERRHDFRPNVFDPGGKDVEQRWFAGVHSNIGGGLKWDGLANYALHWMVDEAAAVGLATDKDFLSFFESAASSQMSEKTAGFKVLDTTLGLWRGFKGERDLLEVDGMTLDPSVFLRLDDPKLDYRPKNLLRYLGKHPELHDQLGDEVRAASKREAE